MAYNLSKQSTTIEKGKTEAGPIYTMGGKVRFIGLPCKPDGSVDLVSQWITFRGCFGGDVWFNVLDYSGKALRISTRVDQNIAHIPNYLDVGRAMLPIDGRQFQGVQFIIPVLDRAEDSAKALDLYWEPSGL
jgi:hypothetical protein